MILLPKMQLDKLDLCSNGTIKSSKCKKYWGTVPMLTELELPNHSRSPLLLMPIKQMDNLLVDYQLLSENRSIICTIQIIIYIKYILYFYSIFKNIYNPKIVIFKI